MERVKNTVSDTQKYSTQGMPRIVKEARNQRSILE